MSYPNLGFFFTSGSRTHVRFAFTTHASAGANVAPNSAFEAADLVIYRAADGAAISATQRSSANGVTMTSPFDTIVGLHTVDIDLTDNSDAGFYASGYAYFVVLEPDETVDSQTLTAVVLATFEITTDGLTTAEKTSVSEAVWDRDATGHQTQGTFGQAIGDPAADTNTLFKAVVTDAAGTNIAADIVDIEGKVDDLESRLGSPSDLGSGATVAANLVDIEAQTDDIGAAGAGLTSIPNSAGVTTLLSRVGTPSDLGSGATVAANLADIEGQTDDIGAAGAGLTAITGRLPAALSANGNMKADIEEVKGDAITGDGSSGNPWGP